MNIGDLVESHLGEIGIVVGKEPRFVNYWLVSFHDDVYSIHSSQLKILE